MNNLRKRAEAKLSEDKISKKRIAGADTQRLIQELQIHQIELEMQNDELQRIQIELEMSRQKYFDLFDLAPLGYLICDKHMIIKEANLTAASILGMERGLLVKQPLSKFIIREDRDIYYKYIYYQFSNNLTKEQIPKNFELRMIKKEGAQFYARIESRPMKDNEGDIAEFRVIMVDITNRKQAEEKIEKIVAERTRELLKTQNELEMAKRLSDIGVLASMVAHELRNPLGVIKIAAYNLRKKIKNPLLDKHFQHIDKKISESAQIINNLLGYSRITMPDFQKVNIYNILNECISNKSKASTRREIFIVSKINSIKNTLIDADHFKIEEIFHNILDNAYQSFKDNKGTIEVEASLVSEKIIRISFRDKGVGIDEEDLENVFNPFFTRKSKGTGLGLTICKQLVNIQGGTISIESEKGEGTIVTVNLPIERE